MEIILKYFPDLSASEIVTFKKMKELYSDWNDKVNLISRKDFENFYERHVLHSLAIAKVIRFEPGSRILDVGTGGGFPGIPLAVHFPECRFHLVDSIGKKITVVKDVAAKLGLENVSADQCRVEQMNGYYDIIISRAVSDLPEFLRLTKHLLHRKTATAKGTEIYYLKGGDLSEEIKNIHCQYDIVEIANLFSEDFFQTKKIVHLFNFT